jgi:ABC-type transport system substrate-binding protein
MSQFIQANLKAIGLDLQLDGLEWAAFTALGGGKPVDEKYQLSVSAWQSISHDPFMLEQLWGCDFRVPKGPNSGMACNEEAIDLWVRCHETGIWPGYTDDILTVSLPNWRLKH